ncbi:sugar-binding transcriptional regulator [Pseudooceanicola nanhaiensis]|jgi:DNA-binding transcriptional regulator LsrR (DeoR family)|uniref:DNA-binding transcriptional regulator n=1 Tax=Pseudooceanicola nanhaiensis TaxID=375761 RepID=A0A917SJN2_9RHOB|nr:sugar-binding domain-containing protein [Pseudooceanicola nanhaiensis]GGL84576.1 DNA-binding transcriptional regulator [Pseudooceanicola nanhaiensis]
MAGRKDDDRDVSPRDFAARAAWMSFVGGLTQDQIAQELGISRQRAQRLVARATAEGLVRVRIAHPIATCLELERALKARFGLDGAWVSPRAGGSADVLEGLASFAAPVLERVFRAEAPQTIAVGTGRTLRAVIEHVEKLDGAHHKLVALNGNVAPDGSATAYEVIVRLAEKMNAPQYPLAIPVVARTREEYALYLSMPHVKASRELAIAADVAFVGLGQIADDAPLYVDGFITAEELASLRAAGAAGEMAGHVFDASGRYLDHPVNERIMGVRPTVSHNPVCCIAAGPTKLTALRGALAGGLFNQLITDEITAQALLDKA